MRNNFNVKASKPVSEAEQALKDWGIEYKRKSDGSILVPGDLDISSKGLKRLPDLSSVTVRGSFSCDNNQLTSLEGAPHTVGISFSCSNNQLTSLAGAPHDVDFCFSCNDNHLTSLEGAPRAIKGNFCCYNNQLTSLEHAPYRVGGRFDCDNNQLTTLEGAPYRVDCHFSCDNNQLTSLEGAPAKFEYLQSDFGKFSSWEAVPEQLRISPENKARLEEAGKAQAETEIYNAVVLQNNLPVKGPLKFKRC